MASRNVTNQSVHDQVLAHRAAAWRADKRAVEVYENPGSKKNASYKVNGVAVYPDIIVGLNDGRWIVEEVETADSVTADEARQWTTFSQLPVDAVNVLVPVGSEDRAKSLTKSLARVAVRSYAVAGQQVSFQRN